MSTAQPLASASVRYSQQYRRCGKQDCPVCRDGGRGHGPYWYAYWWDQGRVRSRYLGKQLPAAEAAPAPTPAPVAVPAGTLRVRTLGGFAVWRAGELVPAGNWGRRKVAALFKCLLGAPDYRLHREQLMDLLFPEAGPAEGARGLRATLYLLRKVLDEPGAPASHVWKEGGLLALLPALAGEPEAGWLDATGFAQAAAGALAGRDAARCRAALALYGGEYLPEDRYEDWAERRRVELRGQHLALLLHLADLSVAAGEVEETLRCLRTVLMADPCQEDGARSLMELLAAQGRRSEALEVYRALAVALEEEVGAVPTRETRAVRARLLAEAPVAIVAPARRTNLPAPLTSFVGREWERAEVTQLLREGRGGSRLLTLVGPGGCGKTRLAQEVARGLLEEYADGVFLVELATFGDAGLLPQAVAEALGLRDAQLLPDQRLVDLVSTFLAGKQLLLVLDNAEHLAAGCAHLAATLLQAAPGLRLLATSQVALGVLGELVWRVPSLSLPEGSALPVADLAAYEAVQLFVERAQAARPRFALSERNAAAVLAVCRRLDGIPLALELAAARLAVLAVEQIALRLDDRFTLLSGGTRTALPRQQTLRATLEWSYQLLTAAERVLLGRLAVFAGGWTLEAAEAVGAGPKLAQRAVLERLGGLVHKSLVQAEAVDGAARYRLLETVREYALERLTERGEAPVAQHAHAQYFLALAERAAPALQGREQIAWFDGLDEEHANLRVALAWLLGAGASPDARRLAWALHWYWRVRGHLTEGRGWLDRALTEEPAGRRTGTALGRSDEARLRYAAGLLALEQGDLTAAHAQFETSAALWRVLAAATDTGREARRFLIRSLGGVIQTVAMRGGWPDEALQVEVFALARTLEDRRIAAEVAFAYGRGLLHHGDTTASREHLLQAQTIYRDLGDVWHLAQVPIDLGMIALWTGDASGSRGWFDEALAAARALKDRALEALARNNLGEVARLAGDDAAAAAQYELSLRMYHDLGARTEVPRLVHNLGYVALHAGDAALARTRFAESLTLFRAVGEGRGVAEAIAGLAAVAAHAGTPDAALRAARLWAVADARLVADSAPVWPADRAERDRYEAMACASVGAPLFDAASAEASGLSIEDVVAEALGA
jgi:predicted ATPase/DNA-binding SARP family transcriptional activator